MRILIVHAQHRELGGEDVVARSEASLLQSHGHTVKVHSAQNPTGAAAALTFAASPWNQRRARAFGAELDQFRPDVVHIHNTWFAFSQSVIHVANQAHTATVMTLHNYRLFCANATLLRDNAVCRECVGRSPWPAVQHRCYRDSLPQSLIAAATITLGRRKQLYERINRYVAPSDLVRNIHMSAGFAPDSIVTVPHFLSDPGPRTRPPSAAKSMIWAGRLAAGKGVETLLEAWRQAALDDYELCIVGDGPLRETLEAVAETNVRFLGFRPLDETRDLIRDARAFLFVSEWLEPFGLVLLEAIAPGTPVIGFSTGDTQRIVGDGGSLVPTGDASALAHRLRTLSDDDLDALGAAARAHFLRNFTPDLHIGALESVFEAARRDTQ